MMPARGDSMRWIFILLIISILALQAAADEEAPEYRLQYGDQVRFIVWNEADLSINTAVLDDGSVSFPLVGRIIVKGMTLAEVERLCVERLETYLVDPIVNVVVTSPHVPRVKILGKVKDPGKFIIQPGDTLLDAIAYAGGLDERCDIKRIIILNRGKARLLNIKALLLGGDIDPDIDLNVYDGDLIFVPEVGRPNWEKATTIISGIIQSIIVLAAK
jgi:polysaccharide export outer membrane protein